MARTYLAMPASSAIVEVVFSQGSDIATRKRGRLGGDTIAKILYLKSWGVFTEEDGYSSDSEEDQEDKDEGGTSQISGSISLSSSAT